MFYSRLELTPHEIEVLKKLSWNTTDGSIDKYILSLLRNHILDQSKRESTLEIEA